MLLVAVVGAVLVSGCTAETPANDTLPTASEGAESSAELEPLGPADFPMPVEAREQTAAGADAMATYYLTLVDRISTGLGAPGFDSQPIRNLSSGCAYCLTLADSLDTLDSRGERFSGGEWTLSGINSRLTGEAAAETVILIAEAASQTIDSQGAPVAGASFPAVQLSGGLVLRWQSTSSAWIVTQFDLEQA